MKKDNNFQAKGSHIGLMAIVADNSYIHYPGSVDTKDWEVIELAGKTVRINAKPFKKTFKMPVNKQRMRTREFVTVQYGGHLYVVLNSFKVILEPKFKWLDEKTIEG